MYRLDKTAFAIQSKKQAANTTAYWLSQTPAERWRAAWYLTCCAYCIDPENPPRLDHSVFKMRKMGKILNIDFTDFLTSLKKIEVRYILVSGYAVIYHGYNRTTGDLPDLARVFFTRALSLSSTECPPSGEPFFPLVHLSSMVH